MNINPNSLDFRLAKYIAPIQKLARMIFKILTPAPRVVGIARECQHLAQNRSYLIYARSASDLAVLRLHMEPTIASPSPRPVSTYVTPINGNSTLFDPKLLSAEFSKAGTLIRGQYPATGHVEQLGTHS